MLATKELSLTVGKLMLVHQTDKWFADEMPKRTVFTTLIFPLLEHYSYQSFATYFLHYYPHRDAFIF